jgi:CheY-like chemotaxis protein
VRDAQADPASRSTDPDDGPPREEDLAAIVRAAKADRANGGPANPRRRRCLIVDDSRVIRKIAQKIVCDMGYEASEAENGEEALARCKATMPDLILLDWNMPVMGGIEFVTRLRRLPSRLRPTVIFCTSKTGAKDIHEGIAAGADDFLVKPFDKAQLREKLEQLEAI